MQCTMAIVGWPPPPIHLPRRDLYRPLAAAHLVGSGRVVHKILKGGSEELRAGQGLGGGGVPRARRECAGTCLAVLIDRDVGQVGVEGAQRLQAGAVPGNVSHSGNYHVGQSALAPCMQHRYPTHLAVQKRTSPS